MVSFCDLCFGSKINKRITSASVIFMDYSEKEVNGSVDAHYSLVVEFKVCLRFQFDPLSDFYLMGYKVAYKSILSLNFRHCRHSII